MIWTGNGNLKMEDDEPVFRSCSRCNSAHHHLDDADRLHVCFQCENYWVRGIWFCDIESEADFDVAFKALGMKPGDSTRRPD